MKERKRLRINKLNGRRETIYKYIGKKNNGTVPCFVCKRHVREKNATLEHIIPLSKGGTDDMSNLSISHYNCNVARGNDENFTWDRSISEEASSGTSHNILEDIVEQRQNTK